MQRVGKIIANDQCVRKPYTSNREGSNEHGDFVFVLGASILHEETILDS